MQTRIEAQKESGMRILTVLPSALPFHPKTDLLVDFRRAKALRSLRKAMAGLFRQVCMAGAFKECA